MPAQVIVTLDETNDKLRAELPGINGMRRKVELRDTRQQTVLDTERTLIARLNIPEPRDPVKRAAWLADRPHYDDLAAALQIVVAAYDRLSTEGASVETVLRTVLDGMMQQRYSIGEDGAPTQSQVRHWEKHEIWADPLCPHCKAEGRLATPQRTSNYRVTKADKARLGLRARGYTERSPGRFFKDSQQAILVSPTGTVAGAISGKVTRQQLKELLEKGQEEANKLRYTSPEYRTTRVATYSNGVSVNILGSKVNIRVEGKTPAQLREEAINAKVARVSKEITW